LKINKKQQLSRDFLPLGVLFLRFGRPKGRQKEEGVWGAGSPHSLIGEGAFGLVVLAFGVGVGVGDGVGVGVGGGVGGGESKQSKKSTSSMAQVAQHVILEFWLRST